MNIRPSGELIHHPPDFAAIDLVTDRCRLTSFPGSAHGATGRHWASEALSASLGRAFASQRSGAARKIAPGRRDERRPWPAKAIDERKFALNTTMMRMAGPQHADVLVEREIDRIANTPCPLAEREQQIAKLEEEIDRLRRTEEAVVVRPAHHVNRDVRRGSCWV